MAGEVVIRNKTKLFIFSKWIVRVKCIVYVFKEWYNMSDELMNRDFFLQNMRILRRFLVHFLFI